MAVTGAGGYYPPVGFHFKVEFVGIGNDNDVRFQSVSGLNIEYDTETFKEGGENRFEHKLPMRTKYPDLSLKRGMLTDSLLIKWLMDALQNRSFKTVQINVTLLNENHEPLKTWQIYNAWPKKWSISDFNAQENSLVVESIDISYTYFTIQ
jgi:phage tail-like protein